MKNESAIKISDIVNKTTYVPIIVGVELSTDHRYLVNQMFRTFLHFAGQLARNYEDGYFDERNEFACLCAKIMIDAVNKSSEIDYHLENFKDEYNRILKICYE